MSSRNFRELIEQRWAEGKCVCVGLDSEFAKLPEHLRRHGPYKAQLEFNVDIVNATIDYACAYKLNSAFYEAEGIEGLRALEETIKYINGRSEGVADIYDAKRGDIGNSNNGYIKAAFEWLQADAITVHPYLGQEDGLQPLLDCKDKGIFVLCRTSNKGGKEFQDLEIGPNDGRSPRLYEYIARQVAEQWDKNNNCGLVVGANYPEELKRVREIVGDLPLLLPAAGKQGADVEAAVKAGQDSRGRGIIINSSRDIIFATPQENETFADAARRETIKLHNLINQSL